MIRLVKILKTHLDFFKQIMIFRFVETPFVDGDLLEIDKAGSCAPSIYRKILVPMRIKQAGVMTDVGWAILNADVGADIVELGGCLPPLTDKQSRAILGKAASGTHTYSPQFVSLTELRQRVIPAILRELEPNLGAFVVTQLERLIGVRSKLSGLRPELVRLVGSANLSFSWLDRLAHASDSMEHRAWVPEAVITCPSVEALRGICSLLYLHQIPMVPYGEGGGYGMGVTPMVPAVTIRVRGIEHLGPIMRSRRNPNRFEIAVGAGLPYENLLHHLMKQGYVLRCNPNTPRAATGGIAATGSNGGRKAFEVILGGRAVVGAGRDVAFAVSDHEQRELASNPFLLAQKFFGVNEDPSTFSQRVQTAFDGNASLPMSIFVGAEGTTGIIYEVVFEVEAARSHLKGARWHFTSTESAITAARAMKAHGPELEPEYFEILTGESIQRFLLEDFADVFSGEEAAVLFWAVEADSKDACAERFSLLEDSAVRAVADESAWLMRHSTTTLALSEGRDEFDRLIAPREALPKKLRTKCKTDMEIRPEYLPQVLKLITAFSGRHNAENVVFGHLSPRNSAIIHWNIGGFDLYDEVSAKAAWERLEEVLHQAQMLAPECDTRPSVCFSGEHGYAGKAPFLWLPQLTSEEIERMASIRKAVDPDELYNPETLFLVTREARAFRARLLAMGGKVKESIFARAPSATKFILEEALRCTRCNACKVCPVIDAEYTLLAGAPQHGSCVLPAKRSLLMAFELLAFAEAQGLNAGQPIPIVLQDILLRERGRMRKCFYCRRCDAACAADIDLHSLLRSITELTGVAWNGSRFWGFVYDRLLGHDSFHSLTVKSVALGLALSHPLLKSLRRGLPGPDWLKTYLAPPRLAWSRYRPNGISLPDKAGVRIGPSEGLSLHPIDAPGLIALRFRGCFDTIGRPAASRALDRYFESVLQARFVDLPGDLCCGFPFEADGNHARSQQYQKRVAGALSHTIATIRASENALANLSFVVFSSCPTCCEALRELTHRWSSRYSNLRLLRVVDSGELAWKLIEARQRRGDWPWKPNGGRIALKIPCHNTKAATQAQLACLRSHWREVYALEACCGLAGTGRFKHPRIGTEIARRLHGTIRSAGNPPVVSGCPSCRDGVAMQAAIENEEKEIKGIFEVLI